MRKIAPMIIASSLAFAGAAFAADNTGSPTVSPNTANPQGNSYSDKSPIAKGTNAPMDDTAKAKAEADHDKMKAKKKMKADKSLDTTTSTTSGMTSPAPATTPAPGTTPSGSAAATTGKNGM